MNEPLAFPLYWPTGWKRSDPSEDRFGNFHRPSTFRAIGALREELRKLGAVDVVISTNLRVRVDGYPLSSQAQPADKGAAVYFILAKHKRVLACDKWNRVEDNIWAIAKHIYAIRGQERWGVGTVEQAFLGYAALPSGESAWWVVLDVSPTASDTEIQDAYIAKAKQLHPDRGGGNEAMRKLNEAREDARRR